MNSEELLGSQSRLGLAVAKSVAGVKVVLAVANFGVVLLDRSVPVKDTPESIGLALVAAALFFAVQASMYYALSCGFLKLQRWHLIAPPLDVVFSTLLILATDGYLSPFNLWLALAVVGAGFSTRASAAFLASGLAIIAHAIIASVPQVQPLQTSTFAVRTTYLLGFAAMVTALGTALARQSELLEALQELDRRLADVPSAHTAKELFVLAAEGAVKGATVECLEDGEPGSAVSGMRHLLEVPIKAGTFRAGKCIVAREGKPFSRHEARVSMLLTERLASALQRISAMERLLVAAGQEERLRLADRLHDSFLQTLGGIDLHMEALRENPDDQSIDEIKAMVRSAASEFRGSLRPMSARTPTGPETLRTLLEDRWQGRSRFVVDRSAHLTEGQWTATDMLLREGLNNARRHADATEVNFRIHKSGTQRVHVSLESNGQGPRQVPTLGYGLSRLKTFVEANGGLLYLERTESGGSLLYAVFQSHDHSPHRRRPSDREQRTQASP